MGNKENEIKQSAQTKKSWWRLDPRGLGGLIVAGAVWYYSEQFRRTMIDGFIVLVVAIAAGFFYYRLKQKIKIKNEGVKVIMSFIIIEIIASVLIGFLIGIVDH